MSELGGGYSAQTVLDAGGQEPQALSLALYQCMDRLLPGQVLQVISSALLSRDELPRWCLLNRHVLLEMREHGTQVLYWILKDGSGSETASAG